MKRGIVGPAFAARAERRGSSQLEPLFWSSYKQVDGSA